jgi:hypothetical protein
MPLDRLFLVVSFGILYDMIPIEMSCTITFEKILSRTLMGMKNGNMIMLLEKSLQDWSQGIQDIKKTITKYHETYIIGTTKLCIEE